MHTAHTHPAEPKGRIYISELAGLYNQYFVSDDAKKLLFKKISELNSTIDRYISVKEKNTYSLFCEVNYDKTISDINDIKNIADFFYNTVSILYRTTTDMELHELTYNSMRITQNLIIKLIDYSEMAKDINAVSNVPDENSIEYNNKMAEIVEAISSKTSAKFSNSIRESLGL